MNELEICKEWLSYQKRTKYPNTSNKVGSYRLKHIVERWAGTYISDDTMREALDQMGFLKKQFYNSYFYNISAKRTLPPICTYTHKEPRPNYNDYNDNATR